MWGTAVIVLVVAAILELIAVEILRSVIHRRRERRDGIGGTQDIAMWGTLIGWLLIIGAGTCGMIWILNR
jgi:hypothetical protein